MKTAYCFKSGATILLLGAVARCAGAAAPDGDQRLAAPVTLNTPRTFPAVESLAQWQARADLIRQQTLFSAGLWPRPEKTPLQAQVFGRTEHGDFSVEKVLLQTYPGFYLAGNLYRPLNKGRGPFPGVLNPHGHWSKGRLEDGKEGSIPARCISQARMGMVAFAYDMVGYNDTQFADAAALDPGYKRHRLFGTNATDLLWNISLMGLQTWNSIRALDFLAALPDVDTNRLACTGASGGGTQTFILGAVDDRLAVLAPTVMVSHSMQGGCSCENMPGLRIEFSNMEIACVPAPRPQIFVAATGDWTRAFMTVEGPAIAGIYKLFGRPDQVRYRVLDFKHNYNQATREQVYSFFAQHLLHHPPPALVSEAPYPPAAQLDLAIFPAHPRPANAVTMDALRAYLVAHSLAWLEKNKPARPEDLGRFRAERLPLWRQALQLDWPVGKVRAEIQPAGQTGNWKRAPLWFGRQYRGDRVPAFLLEPAEGQARGAVVLVHPDGKKAFLEPGGQPAGLARALLEKKWAVLLPDLFGTGENQDPAIAAKRAQQADLFFTTYNRTDTQERVQDLATAGAFLRQRPGAQGPVVFCGLGRAGYWAALAAPAADAVAADLAGLEITKDIALLDPDIFVPGIRTIGGLEAALMLAAPKPLFLQQAANFPAQGLEAVYGRGGRALLQVLAVRAEDRQITDWLEKSVSP